MMAIGANTHIEVLSLVNSNLRRQQGIELAAALRANGTIKMINLEANYLDSQAVREIAEAITTNCGSKVEHLRVMRQKQAGDFFGRLTEEAFGNLMEKNETIVKLGFECNDVHVRNIINRGLLRNNDFARQRRRSASMPPEESVTAEEKSLSCLELLEPPDVPAAQVFGQNGDPDHTVFRSFVANKKRLPTMPQLQNYAKNRGTPLKYSTIAPLIKLCRSRLLDAAVTKEVTVADIFMADSVGDLQSWSESNGSWSLEIWTSNSKKYAYKSTKDPAFLVSDAWAEWLKSG